MVQPRVALTGTGSPVEIDIRRGYQRRFSVITAALTPGDHGVMGEELEREPRRLELPLSEEIQFIGPEMAHARAA